MVGSTLEADQRGDNGAHDDCHDEEDKADREPLVPMAARAGEPLWRRGEADVDQRL